MCDIYPELTMKAPERRQWHRSGVFIINFEQIKSIFEQCLWLKFVIGDSMVYTHRKLSSKSCYHFQM